MAGPFTRAVRLLWAYARIVFGLLTKRRWQPKPGALLPTSQAHLLMSIEPSRLELLWREIPLYPGGDTKQLQAGTLCLPAAYFLTQAFPCVVECLAELPFPVLGGVVNKGAEFRVYGPGKDGLVTSTDLILHSVNVLPNTRTTPGGHMEFDIHIRSMHTPSGHVLFEATLTLVKLSGRKRTHADHKRSPASTPRSDTTTAVNTEPHVPTPPSHTATPLDSETMSHLDPAGLTLPTGQEQTGALDSQVQIKNVAPSKVSDIQLPDTLDEPPPLSKIHSPAMSATPDDGHTRRLLTEVYLPARLGWRWALLDGDLSPMHMSRWTARLVGFKTVIANVNCIMAHVEAAMMSKGIIPVAGPDGGPAPYSINLTYKLPCPLPVRLKLWQEQDTSATPESTSSTTAGTQPGDTHTASITGGGRGGGVGAGGGQGFTIKATGSVSATTCFSVTMFKSDKPYIGHKQDVQGKGEIAAQSVGGDVVMVQGHVRVLGKV